MCVHFMKIVTVQAQTHIYKPFEGQHDKGGLLLSSAEMILKPLRQTVKIQIRLLQEEQSDLGPHCLSFYFKR